MKRIGHIDGKTLFECILERGNIMEAIDNAAKGHSKDPQVE